MGRFESPKTECGDCPRLGFRRRFRVFSLIGGSVSPYRLAKRCFSLLICLCVHVGNFCALRRCAFLDAGDRVSETRCFECRRRSAFFRHAKTQAGAARLQRGQSSRASPVRKPLFLNHSGKFGGARMRFSSSSNQLRVLAQVRRAGPLPGLPPRAAPLSRAGDPRFCPRGLGGVARSTALSARSGLARTRSVEIQPSCELFAVSRFKGRKAFFADRTTPAISPTAIDCHSEMAALRRGGVRARKVCKTACRGAVRFVRI